ncbi:MAG: hypothetical protein QOG79_1691 [Mycobacterium sp.]|jgi:hypothetical protein|nr:hypothetical protein [Mycobacterium sp.]
MQVFTTTEGVVRIDDRGATLLADLASLDDVLATGQWDQLVRRLPHRPISPARPST